MRITPPRSECQAARRRDGRPGSRGRAALLAVAIAVGAVGTGPARAGDEKKAAVDATPRTWYAQTVLHGGLGMSVTYLWSHESRFRAETVIRGHRIVTIVNGNTYYVYDALTRAGYAIRRAREAVAADSRDRRPFGNELAALIAAGGEKIRDEIIAGNPTEIYQTTDEKGRRVVWVTGDEQRLPLRIEVFDRESGETRFKEYVDWIKGVAIPDAFFSIDPGLQVEAFEIDAYIQHVAERGIAESLPIFYEELLRGPASN